MTILTLIRTLLYFHQDLVLTWGLSSDLEVEVPQEDLVEEHARVIIFFLHKHDYFMHQTCTITTHMNILDYCEIYFLEMSDELIR